MIKESLSVQEARKLVLLSQDVYPAKVKGLAIDATRSAIEQLGYIQIDTISAIQRAHHHTLWNRNPRYLLSHIDQLISDKSVFEYWSHAAAYLPMRDYRYSLLRKKAIAEGRDKHWYEPDPKLMKMVLTRISDEGPLMAKDFEYKSKKVADWGSKPAKRALEQLFMQGDLMISKRVNFHKVYDLTERVLPVGVDTSLPDDEEYARFLIMRFLRSNGIGQAGEMAYLLKNTKTLVSDYVREMLANEELISLKVNSQSYYALSSSLDLLNKPLNKSKLKILSPFDNLVIQRRRMQQLFDFNYVLECYVPEAKRKIGYFSLPVLWQGEFVAQMDCKADRKAEVLSINNLVLESNLNEIDALTQALAKELLPFLSFNNCKHLKVKKCSSIQVKKELLNKVKLLDCLF